MQKRIRPPLLLAIFWAISSLSFSASIAAVKDQSRLPAPQTSPLDTKNPSPIPDELLEKSPNSQSENPLPLAPKTLPKTVPEAEPETAPIKEPVEPHEGFDIEDIPAIEQIALTLDIAKRAINAFAQVGTRYDDKGLNDYPTLKEFVEKTDAGKALEKEIQQHGFKDIVEWNNAIMNVNFAYGALIEDPTHEIQQQIQEVRESTTLTDKKKLRIIASLNALIPPKSNIKIIRQLNDIPEYRKKLNLLNPTE